MIYTKLTAYAHLMRLERPIGSLLLAWSSLWGLWLAGEGHPPAFITAVILLGTWTMRSAGCVFNDFADRHFDGRVERTQQRPLAKGTVSALEALLLGIILLALNLWLVLLLNWQSILFAVICAVLALFYPFCKRFFPTPQLVLGFAFASPILMAQTAILGRITLSGALLFLASVFWALVYDTYYAVVDREDDLKIGLHSSAIFAQGYEHRFLASMSGLVLIFLLLAGFTAGLNHWYYLGVLLAALLLAFELWHTRRLTRESCARAFSHNNWVGAAVLLGFVLAYLP